MDEYNRVLLVHPYATVIRPSMRQLVGQYVSSPVNDTVQK
jgi:hypothetical protein